MSLQRVVAAPYKQTGSASLSEQQLVVGLSLHRDWFSPDQAKQIVARAHEEGLIEPESGEYVPTFDPGDVRIPRDFSPDQSVLRQRSTFEQMLDAVVAGGTEKRTAVAGINRLQRDLDLTIEAAAALYATEQGVDVSAEIQSAIDALAEDHSMGS